MKGNTFIIPFYDGVQLISPHAISPFFLIKKPGCNIGLATRYCFYVPNKVVSYMCNTRNLNDAQQWYVVYTLSRFEKKIHQRLNHLSIHSFLPLHHVLREWSDRKKKVELPLFPNYLFIKISKRDMCKVLSLPGVIKFVSNEGYPTEVPESEIEIIRRLVNYGGNIAIVNEEEAVKEGDKVKISYGPFSGIEGIIINKQGKQRLLILLEKIDRRISVELSSGILEKVG